MVNQPITANRQSVNYDLMKNALHSVLLSSGLLVERNGQWRLTKEIRNITVDTNREFKSEDLAVDYVIGSFQRLSVQATG